MANILLYNGKPVSHSIFTYSMANIAQSVPVNRIFDSLKKRLFGNINQLLSLVRDFSRTKCCRRITVLAVEQNTDINTYNISILNHRMVRRNPMYDLLVD